MGDPQVTKTSVVPEVILYEDTQDPESRLRWRNAHRRGAEVRSGNELPLVYRWQSPVVSDESRTHVPVPERHGQSNTGVTEVESQSAEYGFDLQTGT